MSTSGEYPLGGEDSIRLSAVLPDGRGGWDMNELCLIVRERFRRRLFSAVKPASPEIWSGFFQGTTAIGGTAPMDPDEERNMPVDHPDFEFAFIGFGEKDAVRGTLYSPVAAASRTAKLESATLMAELLNRQGPVQQELCRAEIFVQGDELRCDDLGAEKFGINGVPFYSACAKKWSVNDGLPAAQRDFMKREAKKFDYPLRFSVPL